MHQTVSDYGENLYAMWSSKPIVVRAKDAFLSWYNEKDHYDYAKGPTKGRVTGISKTRHVIERVKWFPKWYLR